MCLAANWAFERFPIVSLQAGKAVDLLDQQDVAGVRIG